MPEGGEGPQPSTHETSRIISEADAALAANREAQSQRTSTETDNAGTRPEPFRGAGEDVAEHRDRFERLLALTVGTRREVRRNEDGSKTAFAFAGMHVEDWQQVMKLREAAALAGIKEAFTPLMFKGTSGESLVQLGYEEAISQDTLPGPLQDPPWSQPEHEGTRETPL
jgi:hypothetical protein